MFSIFLALVLGFMSPTVGTYNINVNLDLHISKISLYPQICFLDVCSRFMIDMAYLKCFPVFVTCCDLVPAAFTYVDFGARIMYLRQG